MNEPTPGSAVRELLTRVSQHSDQRSLANDRSDQAKQTRDQLPSGGDRPVNARTPHSTAHASPGDAVSHRDLYAMLWPDLETDNEKAEFVFIHAKTLRARARESAHLLAVIGLLWEESPALWAEDYARLRAHLLQTGLSKSGWRQLANSGARLWSGASQTKRFVEAPVGLVVSLANGVAALNRSALPPDEVVCLMAQVDGYMESGEELRVYSARLLRAVWDRWIAADAEVTQVIATHEIVDVIDWWHRSARRDADVPRGAGWTWFLSAAREWWKREELSQLALSEQWPCTLTPRAMGDLAIVPLNSSLALWEEARAMRNCLASEVEVFSSIRSGRNAAFSIRCAATQRRVATFTAKCCRVGVNLQIGLQPPVYLLDQIKGFANQKVAPDLELLARRYLLEEQSGAFSYRFGSGDFKHGQAVLLVRPDLPENLGIRGEITSLEPVHSTVPNQYGDCRVDWQQGYSQPANFEQMIPLVPHLGHITSPSPARTRALDEGASLAVDVKDDDDRCPLCRIPSQNGPCAHLILFLDREEGPLSGLLFEGWQLAQASLTKKVFRAVFEGQSVADTGAEMEDLRAMVATCLDVLGVMSMQQERFDERVLEARYDAFEDAWQDVGGASHIARLLQEALESIPTVQQTPFEISSAPGLTWRGDSYWAANANAVAEQFRARFDVGCT